MDLQSGPEIKFAVIARSMTAYSKGEKYAEKCDSDNVGNGFVNDRKRDTSSRDNSSRADPNAAARKLQLGLPC
jgi:hypothetical protein